MADSRELVGVRPYRPGDPMRDLHAKTWARIGEPAVREFQEEFFARVAIVLDVEIGRASRKRFEAAVSLVAGIVARLTATEAIVDVLLLGTSMHPLSVGRSLGTIDLALDLLGSAEPGAPFAEDTMFARLGARLPRLSSVVFISLHWDDARAKFVSKIRGGGTSCRAFVVDDAESDDDDGVTRVSPHAILAGEAVRC